MGWDVVDYKRKCTKSINNRKHEIQEQVLAMNAKLLNSYNSVLAIVVTVKGLGLYVASKEMKNEAS